MDALTEEWESLQVSLSLLPLERFPLEVVVGFDEEEEEKYE